MRACSILKGLLGWYSDYGDNMADTISTRVKLLEDEQRSDRSFREQVIRDMADLSMRIQRTEINVETMKPRFDKIDMKLDAIADAAAKDAAVRSVWAPLVDMGFKVATALVIAYLAYKVGIK